MKKFIFTTTLLLISTITLAQDTSKWSAFATYSPWDLWLPGKFGALVSYKPDAKRTYELAWQKGSYGFDLFIDDIGSVSEQRIHLSTRSFRYESSFNYQYGLSYNAYRVNLGKSFATVDLYELKTLSFLWGVGNRWELEHNISVGVDWFKVFIPFYVLDNKDDARDEASSDSAKDDLDDLIKAFSHIPTFTLLHFEVGYRF